MTLLDQATRERSMRGRRVPSFMDWAIALPILLVGLLEAAGGTFPGPPLLAAAVQLVSLLPIAFRRLAPVPVIAISAAAYLPHVVAYGGASSLAQLLGGLVLLYAVGRHADRRSLVAGAAIGVLLIVVLGLRGVMLTPADWTFALVFSAAALGVGMAQRAQAQRSTALAGAAERARAEQVAAAQAAVREERARLARELHDVVAHNVGLMVLQAGGARSVLDTAPERAREALAQVEQTGRQTLAEMRQLVGLLRDHDGADRQPLPRLGSLPALLDETRSAGLSVTLEVDGTPVELLAGLELAVYRLIQEALTNVRKHAPGAKVDVRLDYRADGLRVSVTDDGQAQSSTADGTGHGLIGMQERVRLYGGVFEAGPRPGGGFRVEATLPRMDGA